MLVLFSFSHEHGVQVVLEIAMGAAAEYAGSTGWGERNTMLGIIYDEQLRKEVENKCGQLGAAWNYSSMFLAVDEGILRKARRFEFVQCISMQWLVLKCGEGNMISRTKQNVRSWWSLPEDPGAASMLGP